MLLDTLTLASVGSQYSRELTGRIPVHYPLMRKTVIVVAIMLAAFLAGVPIALVAISGAAYTLLTRRVKPEKVYREIDWELLVLFTGLFVVIAGLQATGLVEHLLGGAAAVQLHRPAVLTAVTAIVSNLVSNVPAVLLWRPVVPRLPHPDFVWLVMAMSSTFAGNLTLLGSMANLIVAERAAARGTTIGFWEYARVGVPVTLLTIAWGVVTLLWIR